MASNTVPYDTVTALVPAQKEQSCTFEVAPLLPWSPNTGTQTELLCKYSMVTGKLLQKSSSVTSVSVPVQ